jgi:hypothetical protein
MLDQTLYKDVVRVIEEKTPVVDWEIVDVTFGGTPDTDLVIRHHLLPKNPNAVQYTVLRQTTPGVVYENRTPTNYKSWTTEYIVLRSDTAHWSGRLLLTLMKNKRGEDVV